MSTITLPNGSTWYNDGRNFTDQEANAKYWYMESLKLAHEKDNSVLRIGLSWIDNVKSKEPFYNELERNNLILSCTGWYKYIGGPTDEDFFNEDNWLTSSGNKFLLYEKV